MKKVGASRFKEQCLAILDEVDEDGIVITKHGRPVARLVAYREVPTDLIGSMSDAIEIHGDIQSTGIRWNAES